MRGLSSEPINKLNGGIMSDAKKYKYPLIPKKYFPAVMFACKMIREGIGRNVACKRAANYYDVEEEAVSHHLAMRAGAGNKGKHKTPVYVVWTDHRWNVFYCWGRSRFEKTYRGYNEDLHKIVCAEFSDKSKAEKYCAELNGKYTCLEDAQEKGAVWTIN